MEAAGGGQEAETSELPLLLSARCHQHCRCSHCPETLWGRWHNGVGAWEHPKVLGCPSTSCPALELGRERHRAQPPAASSSPGQGILLCAVSREGM